MITDWLDIHGDPEVAKKVEADLCKVNEIMTDEFITKRVDVLTDTLNKSFLDRFLEIGFTKYKDGTTSIGKSSEYKYYPDYLGDNHYTLVTFTHYTSLDTDYRLYIHSANGGFVDSIFQLSGGKDWNDNYLNKKFDEIFVREVRDVKLNNIIYVV